MRKLRSLVAVLLFAQICMCAGATQQETPQTARQALMEMFFAKEPGTFMKHLPAATHATLDQSGVLSNMHQYSQMAGQWQTQGGKNFQTFDSGSVIFTTEDPKTGQKTDMYIEGDSLRGDQDDIQTSFHVYKNGQEQRTPFMPKVIFSMKQESGVWKLFDIAVTINVPLADPDLLKSFSDGIKAHGAVAQTQAMQSHPFSVQPVQTQAVTRTFGGDTGTLAALRTIVTAETTYAASYPAIGYTCTLSDLDGFGGGEPNEHQAMLINSGLASGKYRGYSFALTQCGNAPTTRFQLTASPIGESYGRRAFCTDQTATIRSSADGNATTCLASGTAVQ